MIKNCFGLRKKYKEHTSQIRVNKKINRSCINNDVPELSHQENNNYFYNTKISRLILQEAPNHNIQNVYQQPSQINKNISIKYDVLQGKVNNFFYQNKINQNFYHKNSSFQNLPIDRIKLNNDDYIPKDINAITYINFDNISNNDNFNDVFDNNNNKTEGKIISKSLRITANGTKNQEINEKMNIRQNSINNYYIKNNKNQYNSPENTFFQTGRINIKNKFKSPKININQNNEENAFKTISYKSKQNFYKKKNDMNEITKNKKAQNSSIIKEYLVDKKIKNLNSQEKLVNQNSFIYYKNSPLNSNSIEINKRSNEKKGLKIKNKIRSFKIYDSDNDFLNKKLEKFCEILEEIYFISFKSSYNYFLQNLKLFIKDRNISRTLILRRFDDVKKHKKIKENNEIMGINIVNYNKFKDIIYNNKYKKKSFANSFEETNKSTSPSKFKELQNNLTKSMMKIDNDQYIKMFNNIFKGDKNDIKRFPSPCNDRFDTKINDNSFQHFYGNIFEKDKSYNKYNTSTTSNNLFQRAHNKMNNLKISTEIGPHNKYLINDNNKTINHNQSCEIITDKEIYFNPRWTNNGKREEITNKIIKIRKNSCLNHKKYIKNMNSDINLSERKKESNQNTSNDLRNILYSKPLNKKAKENSRIKEKNRNIIRIENNQKNNSNSKLYSKNNPINFNRILNSPENEIDVSNYIDLQKIIIKNVKTIDKRLFVVIKYIPFRDNNKWASNNKFQNKNLFVINTDTIEIINNRIIKRKSVSEFDNYNDFQYNKFSINRYSHDSEKEDLNCEDINEIETINKKYYNKYIIINDKTKNATKYLVSLLHNINNDNVKQVLYSFFKNLRKIKRNSLIYTMKYGNKNHYIRLSKKPNQNYLNENILQTESSNITRNKNEENLNNLVYNNSQDILFNSNLINQNSKINDNVLSKKFRNSLAENKNKKIENRINLEKQNDKFQKKFDEKNKEKIEEKKLAKLGKLFNNLNKENNIINTIKEQFLDWANKNEIRFTTNINSDIENKAVNKKTKEYQVKTFDRKYLSIKQNLIFNKDINNDEKEFEDKLNNFKIKLILFSLDSNVKINNKKKGKLKQ